MVVGVAVRYVAGEVNERPDARAHRGRAAQPGPRHRAAGARVERRDDEHREYRGWTRDGQQLTVQVLDRDLVAFGAFYSIYRVIRLRTELARPPLLSLERLAERRSLLAYAMMAAHAPIPRLVAGIPVGADTIVLAYEYVDGVPLDQLPDGLDHDQLVELWKSVRTLHVRRITHRGLTVTRDPARPRRAPGAADPAAGQRVRLRPAAQPRSGPAARRRPRSWSARRTRCGPPRRC